MFARVRATAAAGPEADEPKGAVDACCSATAPDKVEEETVALYLGDFSGSAARLRLRGRDASRLLARLEGLPSWPSVRASLDAVLREAAALVEDDGVLGQGKVSILGLPPLSMGPPTLPFAVKRTSGKLRPATHVDGRVLSGNDRLVDALSLGRGDWALWTEASRGVSIDIGELGFVDLKPQIFVVLRDCNMQGPYVLGAGCQRLFLDAVGSAAGQRVSALGRGFPSKSEAVAYSTGLGLNCLPSARVRAPCNALDP
jgi:hypothetical protein